MNKVIKNLPKPSKADIKRIADFDIEGKKEMMRDYFPLLVTMGNKMIMWKATGPKADAAIEDAMAAIADIIDMPGAQGFNDSEEVAKKHWTWIRMLIILVNVLPCIAKLAIGAKVARILRVVMVCMDDILDWGE